MIRVGMHENRGVNFSRFALQPISSRDADALRNIGGQIYVADERRGYPCRQCLSDAQVGEELILVSHDPFSGGSPYRSASPIFLHRTPCVSPESDDMPTQLTCRQLSVRSFDENEMMIDAAVIDGIDLETTVETFFGVAESALIHVHNAMRGCWAVTIERT